MRNSPINYGFNSKYSDLIIDNVCASQLGHF